MKNKKIHKVKLEPDYNFNLIGISSSEPDYKLCWQINQELSIEFKRINDLILLNKSKNEQSFALYKTIFENTTLLFISNKGEHGVLIKELKTIDYFIMVYNNNNIFLNNFKKNLKTISGINGIFSINITTLKSKNKFNFEIPE